MKAQDHAGSCAFMTELHRGDSSVADDPLADRHLRQLCQTTHRDRGDRIVRVLGQDFRQHAAGVLQRGVVALQPRLHGRNGLIGVSASTFASSGRIGPCADRL